jgi:quinol monooxygenase YgiN
LTRLCPQTFFQVQRSVFTGGDVLHPSAAWCCRPWRPRRHTKEPSDDRQYRTVTLVNVLTVDPANHDKLLALLRDNTETTISTLKGWIATSLIASKDKRKVIIYSQWQTLADVEAMRTEARMVAYFPRLAALAAFDSIVGDVVYNRSH